PLSPWTAGRHRPVLCRVAGFLRRRARGSGHTIVGHRRKCPAPSRLRCELRGRRRPECRSWSANRGKTWVPPEERKDWKGRIAAKVPNQLVGPATRPMIHPAGFECQCLRAVIRALSLSAGNSTAPWLHLRRTVKFQGLADCESEWHFKMPLLQ